MNDLEYQRKMLTYMKSIAKSLNSIAKSLEFNNDRKKKPYDDVDKLIIDFGD